VTDLDSECLAARFARHVGHPPDFVVRSPGRVNLIGEHTDYSEGFVFPMAVDRHIRVAARRRSDRIVRVVSELTGEPAELDLDRHGRRGDWSDYVSGVAAMMEARGDDLVGFEAVMSSDLPVGAGMSSSAALELAVIRVFSQVSAIAWEPAEAARTASRVENEWLGLRSGIMDQLVSASGIEGHALLIDCRDLAITPIPMPETAAIVVLDTGTRRRLDESRYNERRAQSEAARDVLGVSQLRDAGPEDLESVRFEDPMLYCCADHVITENVRTLAAAEAMSREDVSEMGRLMVASHQSLRDDFEVSSAELDAIVAAALESPGCLGARMIGGGFAGCAIALVETPQVDEFLFEAEAAYRALTSRAPSLFPCRAVEGTSVESADCRWR